MALIFSSTTNISLSLQARDWHYLASIMKGNELYEDLMYNLKGKLQIANPPIGATPVIVDNQYLGVILSLFYDNHQQRGKEIGKTADNRFRPALVALNLPEITTFLLDMDALELARENDLQEIGRKYLRGRLV